MEATLKYKVAEILTKYNFSKDDASFISDVLSEIDDKQNHKFEVSKDLFLTQKDKVELIEKIKDVEISLSDKIANLHKSIFIVGVIQFLAIVGSVLAIFNFMLK
ncbi:hypothetical protein [Rubrolithibacter danxiaensis]|uniref:hypothetical protein n=1 Tax=Rubrolithibacter danxiaensis TaxID=3390805 RepID=UPI003BF89ED2